ncbi:MAG: family 43 glycosylhydrolase [bacterium]
MRKQGFNPYLPSWEYVPDGEPYVFGDRVYVYGSHDRFNGHVFCLEDYVCWSAPVSDPAEWRFEGTIYAKTDDPLNPEGDMCLYAPDVTRGPDGRYYLYYVLDKVSVVSVAVCDTPAGRYRFYGYVRYEDGTRLGESPHDEPQFDPGVITEGDRTWLYTGFCPRGDRSRTGPMVTGLGPDMLTVEQAPKTLLPSEPYNRDDGSYRGHEFFEASSIRKIGDVYYFVYSSIVFHELCYATSRYPDRDFTYRGVVVSNCDLHLSSWKPADMPGYYGGNNHGSIVEIAGQWYVFYHRHTNATHFSRQGCVEPIRVEEDGSIAQVEMTSCGSNGGPLRGSGTYPAYIACNLFGREQSVYTEPYDGRFARITQDGRDGDEIDGHIDNVTDGTVVGFKYFEMVNVKRVGITTRGYCDGEFLVKIDWNGPPVGTIKVEFTNVWKPFTCDVRIPDGVRPLYLEYVGGGRAALGSVTLMTGTR